MLNRCCFLLALLACPCALGEDWPQFGGPGAKGISPEKVVGQLAASLGLVPAGSLLSAVELAEELTIRQLRSRLRQAG